MVFFRLKNSNNFSSKKNAPRRYRGTFGASEESFARSEREIYVLRSDNSYAMIESSSFFLIRRFEFCKTLPLLPV